MSRSEDLAEAVYSLVKDLPPELVETLASRLQENAHVSPQELGRLSVTFPQPNFAQLVEEFLQHWRQLAPEVPAQSIALAMRSASRSVSETRRSQQLEFVWTGPDSRYIPLRRTHQALLQLVEEATNSLHIVSFAVYKAEAIVKALVASLDRGVDVAIYLETPDASQGKVAFNPIGALGSELARRASLFVWPLEKRSLSETGRHGSLHAKLALADNRRLLVSSANLTQYAMTLNMESGVLVSGGDIPDKVARHLSYLVESGQFQRL